MDCQSNNMNVIEKHSMGECAMPTMESFENHVSVARMKFDVDTMFTEWLNRNIVVEKGSRKPFNAAINGVSSIKDSMNGVCSESSKEHARVHRYQKVNGAGCISSIEQVQDEVKSEKVETTMSNHDENKAQILNNLERETGTTLEQVKDEVPQALSIEGAGLKDISLKRRPVVSSSECSPFNVDILPSTERRKNPTRASSRKERLVTKTEQAPKSKKSSKNSKNVPKKICLSLMELLKVSSIAFARKRCRSLKKARVSVWGALPNVLDLFKIHEKPLRLKHSGLKKGNSQKKRAPTGRKSEKSGASSVHEVISAKKENFHLISLVPDQRSSVNQRPEDQSEHMLQVDKQMNQSVVQEQESSLTQENSSENIINDCRGTGFQGAKVESVESPDSGVVYPSVDSRTVQDTCVIPNDIKSKSCRICELRSPAIKNFHTVSATFSEAVTSVSPRCELQQVKGKREIEAGEKGSSLSAYYSEGTSVLPSDLRKNRMPSRKSSERKRERKPAAKRTLDCPRIEDDASIAFEKADLLCKDGVCLENSLYFVSDSTMLKSLPFSSSDRLQKLRVDYADGRTLKGTAKLKSSSKRSVCKGKSKPKNSLVQSAVAIESPAKIAHHEQWTNSQLQPGMSFRSFASSGGDNETLVAQSDCGSGSQSSRAAWVCCDDCHKWRSIAVELANAIDERGCRWTCRDNEDKAFADCSVPQAKSNAEINAELEISDDSCDEDGCPEKWSTSMSNLKPSALQQSAWVHVNTNLIRHRARKVQTIDEVMVCQCKPPLDGSMGCGDECLNRMLNIECTPETCPCGNLCSNQQFQKREYAKLKYFRCGKKGFGLRLLEDARQGQFLIEYVGEVLDLAGYEARQREYAFRGQKHFYFMTLNGNEVIDACHKGNLGRFINHSCDPNCRTEKWMINGEVCVGLFANRDLKKGEEVTFDYNYVRVFGAAAKRCLCGSANCRGFIGGDPSNDEILVQSDSDEEHPEPVMISENGEVHQIIEDDGTNSDSALLTEDKVQTEDKVDPVVDFSPPENHYVVLKPSPESLEMDMISASKDFEDQGSKELEKQTSKDFEKPLSSGLGADLKSSRSRSGVKKRKLKTKKYTVHEEKTPFMVPHPQSADCCSSQHEGVEQKLNELLDSHGGIKKERDATKGYLKLLFFSATSGDDIKNETSQSTRDLSLILDALLKTKSRAVLVDVVNKNGLQMLHNIMKQNRRNFNKIPVIRKLLKVLEFLAIKQILTTDHMSSLPSNTEVESFKESIYELTYHSDTQVHGMARNFRNKWLPRPNRRRKPLNRDSSQSNSDRFDPRRHEMGPSRGRDGEDDPAPGCCPRPRKRKSRWDEEGPSESVKVKPSTSESTLEEAPPGFGPPRSMIQTDLSEVQRSAVTGELQDRYRPHLTVSYGIPLALAEQLGTAVDPSQRVLSWQVGPGMPFHPFPPLPPMPRRELFQSPPRGSVPRGEMSFVGGGRTG